MDAHATAPAHYALQHFITGLFLRLGKGDDKTSMDVHMPIRRMDMGGRSHPVLDFSLR